MLNEGLNGKVFYSNKIPMKEHSWEGLIKANLTDEDKNYQQFIIIAKS